jgi:hypothetical protein
MFTTAGISFLTSGANDSGAEAARAERGVNRKNSAKGSAALIKNLMNDLREEDGRQRFIDNTALQNSQDISLS